MLEQIDPVFTDKLSNTFILILSPVLIGSLNSEVHGPYHVSIHVAFYVLIQVFRIIKFPWLLDIFVKFLLSEKISVVLFDIYNSPPPNSPSKIIEFQSEQQENNSGKQSFLSFLKCKDDNLVCLALLLLQYIVTNKGVTQVLLENLQLSPEHNVDSEIFQGLIQIYGTYPLFRFTNYLIVSKILFELKCIDSELLIRQSCCENIMKLKILLESKEFADAFLDYFDEEWEKVKKINFRGNISVFNHNILPMPSNKVALEQRQPENDYELVRSLIKLFFLMRKLIFFLNSDDPDTYPFIYTSQVKDWKCGNSYSTYGMQFTRVWMKSTEETVRYIVEDEDFFVLVEPDLNKIEFATVVAMEKWRNLEARRDEQFQMANLATRAKAKIDYFFSFENPDYFYIETERIQFKIASSRALEITLAESFLLDTHQKFMEKS